MHKITKNQLVRNLNRVLGENVGMEGLKTLLYGWMNYRRYGRKYRKAVANRDWLYRMEVADLSDYAGYDLMLFPS